MMPIDHDKFITIEPLAVQLVVTTLMKTLYPDLLGHNVGI